MNRHWHRAKTVIEQPYIRCVGMSCNDSSHNGVTLLEQCECGQARSVNLHKRATWKGTIVEDREFGSWRIKNDSI